MIKLYDIKNWHGHKGIPLYVKYDGTYVLVGERHQIEIRSPEDDLYIAETLDALAIGLVVAEMEAIDYGVLIKK